MLGSFHWQFVSNVTRQPPGLIFLFVCFTPNDGTYRLHRNVGNSLKINAAEYSRRVKTSTWRRFCRSAFMAIHTKGLHEKYWWG